MKMYQNPIAKHGDYADPFVLRYNGRYYLYCTNPGVLCWSGDDLLHWQPEGPVIPEEEFPGLVPFAPEVVYENGAFYMYTSPHGLGHYVLKSQSPLGPFRKITPNVQHSIDFSIFLDEDGKRYAYWADDEGILGCEMPTPTTFGPPRLVGAFLHGWTEGPFVVKENGVYHLTYTGNHYLSKGYRIHEAMSRHPLGPYQDHPHNPIVVRGEGTLVGLGHSCTVTGPNLLSRYLVYHNLNPDHTRDLNIDRVLLAEEGCYVLGPTDGPQPAPSLPTFADGAWQSWDVVQGEWQARDGMQVSLGAFACRCREGLPQRGAAECNLCAGDATTQEYGIHLTKGDAQLAVRISRREGAIRLEQDGSVVATLPLGENFAYEALHCLRLDFDDEQITVHLDHLLVGKVEWRVQGAALDYEASGPVAIGYTAFSDEAEDVLYYPVPARLPKLSAFSVCVSEAGEHVLVLEAEADAPSFQVDGSPVNIQLRQGAHMHRATLWLPQGLHTVSTEARVTALYRLPPPGSAALQVQGFGPYAKRCEGPCFDDLECTATLALGERQPGWQAGVLVRAMELADGGEGDDPVLGRNFMVGYRVCVEAGQVSLWKHQYDEQPLLQAPIPLADEYTLRISLCGSSMRIGVNGEERMSWVDATPILYGRVGLAVRDCICSVSLTTQAGCASGLEQ